MMHTKIRCSNCGTLFWKKHRCSQELKRKGTGDATPNLAEQVEVSDNSQQTNKSESTNKTADSFCLSEKLVCIKHNNINTTKCSWLYKEEDVKEFIDRYEKLYLTLFNNEITPLKFIEAKNKLKGDKFI